MEFRMNKDRNAGNGFHAKFGWKLGTQRIVFGAPCSGKSEFVERMIAHASNQKHTK